MLLNTDGIVVANLRFGEYAEIDEHDALMDINVIVTSGDGFVSIDGNQSQIAAGQSVSWPKSKLHKLWTTSSTMETIMIERVFQIDS